MVTEVGLVPRGRPALADGPARTTLTHSAGRLLICRSTLPWVFGFVLIGRAPSQMRVTIVDAGGAALAGH